MWDTANRELSMVGRWLSPDPAGLGAVDTSNPQSWNRYAYVGGNPFSFTDPTGLGPPAGVACRNGLNANSPNCVRYSANCTQAAGFCPPDSMNRDALAKQAQPCDEECQYQGRVDDAFNGTHYMDDPNVYSNGRFRLPPASGWFYETYGKGGSIGYDTGSWYYPAIFVDGEDEHPGLKALFDSDECPTCGKTLRSAKTVGTIAFVATGAVLVGVPLVGEAAGAIAACGPGVNSNYGHVTVYCRAWMSGQLIGIGYDPRNGLHVNIGDFIHIPLWPWP